MHEQNETLRSHRNLQPLQLRRNRHCSSFLRLFVGNDATIFKSGRCHEKRWCLRTASTTTSALAGALSSTLSSALSHHRSTQRNQRYENEQNCYYSHHFPLHSFYSPGQKKFAERFYLSLCW